MEPEELKIIAEGMGYKVDNENLFYDRKARFGLNKYNPLTNDTQCMEIMEKLKISVHHCMYKPSCDCDGWIADIYELSDNIGKTINEAVCKAALEYFKQQVKQNDG